MVGAGFPDRGALREGLSLAIASTVVASATTGEAAIDIDAPAEQVYGLVADLSRMGEWSTECYRCEWIDGADGPAVGARFRGRNHIGPVRWTTTGTVRAAEPGLEFSFSTEERWSPKPGREATRWRYRFETSGARTRVVESYEAVWSPLWVRFADLFMPRTRQLSRGMQKTLQRIKAAAEAGAV
jgi:uncharacterized protein YndB with AHSA1/START domain